MSRDILVGEEERNSILEEILAEGMWSWKITEKALELPSKTWEVLSHSGYRHRSPFIDQGYDIYDYYAIDLFFGTMEDMEEAIAEAFPSCGPSGQPLPVRVVPSSSRIQWSYADYFISWQELTTGKVTLEAVSGNRSLESKYYLHSLPQRDRPDLNWQTLSYREFTRWSVIVWTKR